MKKTYLSAPLPFVGQKRMFARKFMKVLEQYPESGLSGVHGLSGGAGNRLLRLQGAVQPVQRHAGRGVPGGPAVPFHRRGYLQYELAYVGLPRRAERAIRASVRLFHLKQILHPGAVRMDREKQKHRQPVRGMYPDGVQRPHKLQLILHGHDAVQKRGCLTAFLCPLLK